MRGVSPPRVAGGGGGGGEPVNVAGLQDQGEAAAALHVAPRERPPPGVGAALPESPGGGAGHQRLRPHLLQEHR